MTIEETKYLPYHSYFELKMEHTYWIAKYPEMNVEIQKVPIYFRQVEVQGTNEAGTAKFESYNSMEEIYGPDAKFDVYWETVDRVLYHQGNRVQQSIDMYNAIEVNVTEKKTEWQRSHEGTYWFGKRSQIKQKRFYNSHHIHVVILCEQTSRVFEMHASIIANLYPNYKDLILSAMKSLLCHEV
jgi:hypothetical protein